MLIDEDTPRFAKKMLDSMKKVDEVPDGFYEVDEIAEKMDINHDDVLDLIIGTMRYYDRKGWNWQEDLVPNINKMVRKVGRDGANHWTFAVAKDFVEDLVDYR